MIWRIRLVTILIVTFFALIIARLFYWQVIRGGELSLLGKKQYTSTSILKPARGEIETNDNFPLVANKQAFLLFAEPQKIEDKKIVARSLAKILEIEEASISASLNQDLKWVPIKSRISMPQKEEIEKLALQGVGFESQGIRSYKEASLAAHLIGIVASDDRGEDKGYFGLEGYYDRQLRGRKGEIREFIDVFGKPILVKNPFTAEKIDGRTLVLHIDRTLQFIVEEKLRQGIERYGAKGGSVAVMEPKSGAILALASFPAYDPGKFQDYDETLFKNPFISDIYEPGSIFKPLIMAAALNEDVVKPDTVCTICSEPINIAGYTIRTWNNKYYKDTNMIKVIEHSDNTGMVFVSQKLGPKKFYSYLSAFGMGEPTDIDLQEESSPTLRNQDKWGELDTATASFGQGVALTGIQMLRAIATIANGGNLMEPHVVAKIIDSDGKEIVIPPKVIRTVISEKTAKIVTEMMVNAVELGEARFAKPKGYRVAGKTGTAQIPIAGHYDPNKTIASFVGFAPSDEPRFIMLVKLDQPTSSPFGAETAAPLFFSIAKDLFTYYNIAPTD